MKEVWVLQHTPPETLGTIADALEEKGIAARYIRTFQGESVPRAMEGRAGLIVMGGPMGVYDQARHPFLRDEIGFIRQALREEKPVLGICLGSQLLAATLGAVVAPGRKKEIGWHTVRLTDPGANDPLFKGVERSFTAFHWHGDVFELPQGAVGLASSELTPHQAFRFGVNAYGLLFHLEVTGPMIREMIRTFSDELEQEGIDATGLMQESGRHLPNLGRIGRAVFGCWADRLQRVGLTPSSTRG